MWRPQFTIQFLILLVVLTALFLFVFRESPGAAIYMCLSNGFIWLRNGFVALRCRLEARQATEVDYLANYWKVFFLAHGGGMVMALVPALRFRP